MPSSGHSGRQPRTLGSLGRPGSNIDQFDHIDLFSAYSTSAAPAGRQPRTLGGAVTPAGGNVDIIDMFSMSPVIGSVAGDAAWSDSMETPKAVAAQFEGATPGAVMDMLRQVSRTSSNGTADTVVDATPAVVTHPHALQRHSPDLYATPAPFPKRKLIVHGVDHGKTGSPKRNKPSPPEIVEISSPDGVGPFDPSVLDEHSVVELGSDGPGSEINGGGLLLGHDAETNGASSLYRANKTPVVRLKRKLRKVDIGYPTGVDQRDSGLPTGMDSNEDVWAKTPLIKSCTSVRGGESFGDTPPREARNEPREADEIEDDCELGDGRGIDDVEEEINSPEDGEAALMIQDPEGFDRVPVMIQDPEGFDTQPGRADGGGLLDQKNTSSPEINLHAVNLNADLNADDIEEDRNLDGADNVANGGNEEIVDDITVKHVHFSVDERLICDDIEMPAEAESVFLDSGGDGAVDMRTAAGGHSDVGFVERGELSPMRSFGGFRTAKGGAVEPMSKEAMLKAQLLLSSPENRSALLGPSDAEFVRCTEPSQTTQSVGGFRKAKGGAVASVSKDFKAQSLFVSPESESTVAAAPDREQDAAAQATAPQGPLVEGPWLPCLRKLY
ncbi:hypothetical protein HK101_001032 [Irineochytrium annulatum]|nr:hypothetical protein HK101_001032 [Irineochytrium annulatum]